MVSKTVMPGLALQSVELVTGCRDRDGCLVLAGDALVGIIVRLSDAHGADSGRWAVEYLPAHLATTPIFDSAQSALAWIASATENAVSEFQARRGDFGAP